MKKRKKIVGIRSIVESILNPKVFVFGNKKKATVDNFYEYLFEGKTEFFDQVMQILLEKPDIFSLLNQSPLTLDAVFSKQILNYEDLTLERAIQLYRVIIVSQIDNIKYFQNAQQRVESLFVKGMYDEIEDILNDLDEKLGQSIWSINIRFSIYAAAKKYEKIDSYLELIKRKNANSSFQDIVRVCAWKSQSYDSNLIIESMVRRANKEFIEGGALQLAAFHSIMSLPYPIYDDVDLIYSIKRLQFLPLIDLYESMIKLTSYSLTNDECEIFYIDEFIKLFRVLNDEIGSNRISNLLNALEEKEIAVDLELSDPEVVAYSEGRYQDVIDLVEGNWQTSETLITKVNIYAKSYIHTKSKPEGLPTFLKEVILQLISIYSLSEANRSVLSLLNLSIKYSSFEVSDHLLISIHKSAPFFFDIDKKEKIITKSKFLNLPLTPLANNLHKRPYLYVTKLSDDAPLHLKSKKRAIEALIDSDEDQDKYLDEFYSLAPIKKDAIELNVENKLSLTDWNGLIVYAANELIKNSNANVCLPLESIAKYIDENCIYTLDSVICSYFYREFSKDNNSEILNEVFEEYILSLDLERPSEIICEELDEKTFFLLKTISKVDVMEYLGCFDDNNDLNIERINILNKLVAYKYCTQSEIDKECKDIFDDILIEGGAAKFNDSKIFVDTKYILEKKRSDIESLLIQYDSDINAMSNSDDVLYKIESMTIPKGSKNESVTRLINLLLIEFMNNPEVGLDKNLSSEIRHGFFGNLLCSKLQNRKLLTELGDDGKYSSNSYWLEYYSMISSTITNDIDEILVKFSHDFNNLIENAEQWMKVSLNGDDEERLFSFSLTLDEFELIKKFIDQNKDSVDNVANYIFSVFHEKLTVCLTRVKRKLNETLINKIDELFSVLIDDITDGKRRTSMSDLLSEIRVANTEVKEDIRTVCEWFSFKKDLGFSSFEIRQAILLSERCFNQINNCDIKIEVINETESTITVRGEHLYAIVFMLINCFNNSYKYSSRSSEVYVHISELHEEGFRLCIKNEICEGTYEKLSDGLLSEIVCDLRDMSKNDLLTNEGGSGLYKSLHGLRVVSNRYNLVPFIEPDKFCVEVTYD
ncbi:hypothetical protein AB6C49_23705 [Vibrio cyclitrophicus]